MGIITTRPETDLRFLKLLRGRESQLHKLCCKDVEQRQLAESTHTAIANLGDLVQRLKRVTLVEILERCFFLLYWNAKHGNVASSTSWDELLERAQNLITDLGITRHTLSRCKTSPEVLEAMDPKPKTWVELVVLETVEGDWAAVDRHIDEILGFVNRVSQKAAGHLKLLACNTFRTPWLAAKLLSTDPATACASAKTLLHVLDTTRESNRSTFESHMVETKELKANLLAFATTEPPVLLWHCNGKFEILFKFLAPRFLMAPDNVLDAERVHARWQWSCLLKRATTFQNLNASLRLTHYMEHNHRLPDDEILNPLLRAEAFAHKLTMEALEAEGVVVLGARSAQHSPVVGVVMVVQVLVRLVVVMVGVVVVTGGGAPPPVTPGTLGSGGDEWQ